MSLEVINRVNGDPIPYAEAYAMQREWVAQRQRNEVPDTLILLTHPPTVTYGKAANLANLLRDEEGYRAQGITLAPTDRGGDVTYHGPGQLIGYPILHLGEGNRDLHRYVRFLESVLIDACHDLGATEAGRADFHAGVWAADRYIAALGVRVTRWVTYHGFALNVTDAVRSDFATIVPCGVAGKQIGTVTELAGRPVTLPEAAEAVERRFRLAYEAAVGAGVSAG